ncbi:type 1 glutamine amidotransferase [Trichloromonas sp.]|uniref:type 1 glutamine amidotransferase n=1 Tax=Trichloromonas sp. TaxID=3069249 RepID=UPI002A3EA52E|nr:type 1 glutamine amidotransferase [Trichloromonas sp.]
MRAHYLQHVPFEGLGSIELWLQNAGYEISNTQFFRSNALPEIEDIDFLVVMGGPMSVNDEQEYPWLVNENEFIRNTVESGKPVLGICLGAQLIAKSMGGKVFPNSVKEIGWFQIEGVESEISVFQFPQETEVFHWHGETFSLPKGAVQIAKSKGCENQAFQIGRNVIGLQFHLETTPLSAQAIVENCRDELVDGEYIQSEAEILSTPQERYSSINSLMGRVLEYLRVNNVWR